MTMYKLFSDTSIIIDVKNYSVEIIRGYWNFTQLLLEFEQENDRDSILKFFSRFAQERAVSKDMVDDEFEECFNRMKALNLLYDDASDEPSMHMKLLFISDFADYLDSFINKSISNSLYSCLTISEMKNIILGGNAYHDIQINPILKETLKDNLKSYLSTGFYTHIFVVLSSVDDLLCALLNESTDADITFQIIDKDFGYIFSTKKYYTGCYLCFSKNMQVRKREQQIGGVCNSGMNQETSIEVSRIEKAHIDIMLSFLLVNILQYLESGFMSLYGRLLAVFFPSLEVHYENFYRLSLCDSCGYAGKAQNQERNLKIQNFIARGGLYENISAESKVL